MLKINKKIKFLLRLIKFFKNLDKDKGFIVIIMFLFIYAYFCKNINQYQEENMIYWIGLSLSFIIFIFTEKITEIIINIFLYRLLKNEYIKANKEIEYLKYVPKERIEYIEEYILSNKQKLEEKLEFEKLKNNISNF